MHGSDAAPRRQPARRHRVGFTLLLAALGGCVLGMLVDGRDGEVRDGLAGPMLLALSLAGAVLAARAGFHPLLDRRTRVAWRTVSVALALGTAGCLAFALTEPFPGPGDYLRLACAPMLLAGLVLFPVPRRTVRDRQRLALDTGIVVSGGFIVLWYWSLGPAVVTPDLDRATAVVAVAYPLADLALVLGATKALLSCTALSSRRPLRLLVCGCVCLVAGDTLMAHTVVQRAADGLPQDESAPVAQWVTLVVAFGLMALAAADQIVLADGDDVRTPTDRRRRSVSLLPYLAVALGYGLLVVVASGQGLYPWGGLVVGAVCMTGLVLARQVVELRESHSNAVTDSMTGLANRPRFNDALLRALGDAERSGVSVGLLAIDLDGFKDINDTFGHRAGDDVLVAFAGLLRSAVSRTDTAGRLGGDEFAVVLPDAAALTNVAAVARRVEQAMTVPLTVDGEEVLMHASIGIAISHPGDDAEVLMHRADTVMYEAKRARRAEHPHVAQVAAPPVGLPTPPAPPTSPDPSVSSGSRHHRSAT
ncbi:MAG TPA: GGDEF domain-containing protein [Actinomycetales bacterium]